jgi:hypothetical protein
MGHGFGKHYYDDAEVLTGSALSKLAVGDVDTYRVVGTVRCAASRSCDGCAIQHAFAGCTGGGALPDCCSGEKRPDGQRVCFPRVG